MLKYVSCLLLATAVFSAPADDKRDKRGLLSAGLLAHAPLTYASAPLVSHAPLLTPSISVAHAPLVAPAVSSISSSSVHIQHPIAVAHAPLTLAHPPISTYGLAHAPLTSVGIAHAPITTISHAPITTLGLAHPPLALSSGLALSHGLHY